jgi:hypothetical protein
VPERIGAFGLVSPVRQSGVSSARAERPTAIAIPHTDEDLMLDRLAKRLVEGAWWQVDDLAEEAIIDRPSACGGGAQHAPCPLGQSADSGRENVPESRRELGYRSLGAARRGARGEELLHEKWIPVRSGEERIEQAVRRWPADGRSDERRDLRTAEGSELDPLNAVDPPELGEVGEDRLAVRDLVRACRDNDQDRVIAQAADEEREKVACRTVGPVQVLDDQHDRALAAEPLEYAKNELEQAGLRLLTGVDAVALVLRSRVELRHQPPELGSPRSQQPRDLSGLEAVDQVAQDFDERCIRKTAVGELETGALEHPTARSAGSFGKLGDES